VALLLVAVTVLAGCAGSGTEPTRAAPGLTWAGYLYGEDLRQGCHSGSDDRYRLVFNAGRPDQPVRILELVGHPDRGGIMRIWTLPVSSVAQLRPAEQAMPPTSAPTDQDTLTPDQFQRVARRLAYGGVFLPPFSQLDLGASKLRWFATGCFDGFYFLSAYTVRPGAVWDIGFIPPME
jgi:hypothetical protein